MDAVAADDDTVAHLFDTADHYSGARSQYPVRWMFSPRRGGAGTLSTETRQTSVYGTPEEAGCGFRSADYGTGSSVRCYRPRQGNPELIRAPS